MRICAIYLILLSSSLLAQTGSIKAKIKKGDAINKKLWNTTFLFNQDTSFLESRSVFRNKSLFDSVPYGQYNVILQSKLGEKIKKKITVNSKKTRLRIKEHRRYYSIYADTTPFISLLSEGDTMTIDLSFYHCINRRDSTYNKWADISLLDGVYIVRYKSNDSARKSPY